MLGNIPFILCESGFVLNGRIADACKRLGFAPKIAARSSQVDFVVELVAANVGVAILPEMIFCGRDELSRALRLASRSASAGLVWDVSHAVALHRTQVTSIRSASSVPLTPSRPCKLGR